MEERTCNGWKYYIDENGAAIIIGCPVVSDAELTVPEMLDGHPVEGISFYYGSIGDSTSLKLPKTLRQFDAAFVDETVEVISVDSESPYFEAKDQILYSKDGKTLVSFPPEKKTFDISCLDGVEVIGDGAFSCCDCITDLTLPDTVTEIGDYAFVHCKRLNSVSMPDSVKKVGKAVFAHSTVKTVRLSANIKELSASFDYDGEGEGFFQDCHIETVVIPEGVEKIGYLTFSECTKLTSVCIPSSVTVIEGYAFNECKALESITVASGNKNFSSRDGVLYSREGELLQYPCNKSDESFAVPEHITKIGNGAFYQARHLKKLVLGNRITALGYRAFACSSIEQVNIPTGVSELGLDVFLYCGVKTLYIPKGVTSINMNSNTNGNINPYQDITVIVDEGSYAHRMCEEYHLQYEIMRHDM